jgi:hypothetical protein
LRKNVAIGDHGCDLGVVRESMTDFTLRVFPRAIVIGDCRQKPIFTDAAGVRKHRPKVCLREWSRHYTQAEGKINGLTFCAERLVAQKSVEN